MAKRVGTRRGVDFWGYWITAGLLALIGGYVAVALIVSAVTPDEPEADSSESRCVDAMAEAAAIPGGENADAELIGTASACKTVDEWVSAARLYPEALGLTNADAVDPEFYLAAICGQVPSAPVCEDAASHGLDTYW